MAVDPHTLKLIAQAVISQITDEEKRQRLIIGIIIAIIVIIVAIAVSVVIVTIVVIIVIHNNLPLSVQLLIICCLYLYDLSLASNCVRIVIKISRKNVF